MHTWNCSAGVSSAIFYPATLNVHSKSTLISSYNNDRLILAAALWSQQLIKKWLLKQSECSGQKE